MSSVEQNVESKDTSFNEQSDKKKFISGVVEGFYGKPWTPTQRVNLFARLRCLGLNTYMYAPKDDSKHRCLWRELYSDLEQDNLRRLISSAHAEGIDFVYALSPGIDIVFSCEKEIGLLKAKLKQVSDLGCQSFALLFDDIAEELALPDRDSFDSFADAQVKISNRIYEHLGSPTTFYFCPTEYCASRAKPNVRSSEYLNTVGKLLHSNIQVMWTGPKVVSQCITVTSLQAVSKVLKRKPVIWDNIHANDYDQRRLFLGPFTGRSTTLYHYINGILTNPNCEYECNFVAIHTFATWVRTACESADAKETQLNAEVAQSKTTSTFTDPKERQEKKPIANEMNQAKSNQINTLSCLAHAASYNRKTDTDFDTYNPQLALHEASITWLREFQQHNDGSSLNYRYSDISNGTGASAMTPIVNPTQENCDQMSSKVKEKPNRMEELIKDDIEHNTENTGSPNKRQKHSEITVDDLLLLSDMFNLPYSHGKIAKDMISEFKWLKSNVKSNSSQDSTDETQEWKDRAKLFHDKCKTIADTFVRILETSNRVLLQELFPYIWDVREVVSLLDTFIKWLGSSKKTHSTFIPDDPEPWLFRGGLAEEMERLLPLDGGSDMFSRQAPSVPSSSIYTIRPALPHDKDAVYDVCLSTYNDGTDGRQHFPNYPHLPGDRYVGTYLRHFPELAFVVEDEEGLCGYVLATANFDEYQKLLVEEFAPSVCSNYPHPETNESEMKYEREDIDFLYNPRKYLPTKFERVHPSHVSIRLLQRAKVNGIGKRLLAVVLSVLKSVGTKGVYCDVKESNVEALAFYKGLGFTSLAKPITTKSNDDDNSSKSILKDTIILMERKL